MHLFSELLLLRIRHCTMFSRAPLRSSLRFIRQVLENQRLRSYSSYRKWQSGDARNGKTLLGNHAGSFVSSGVLIAGSCIGFCYWVSSSSGTSPLLSFANCPEETWPSSDDLQASTRGKKRNFLVGDAYRRRIFFNYERRIRLQSPLRRYTSARISRRAKNLLEFYKSLVFDYFSSVRRPSGEVLMTPADLMRAVVPVFPPSESDRVREGYLRGERIPGDLYCPPSKFFMLFDMNNDGLISFPEYIFFVTLLSIPESSFEVAFKMFDLDNNGEIDQEEFSKVMALMRSQSRQGTQHRDGKRVGLKVKDSVEEGGLLEYFFGKDGQEKLKHGRFVQFLKDLHDEILRLEFSHYDTRSAGTISAKDFALSLVASADMCHLNKLLDRVDEIDGEPSLRDLRISFQEFKDFAELRKMLQSFSLAIFSYGKVKGLLTKRDFQRAASQVCGISITSNVVDIIFHLFDANRDGNLSSKEFIRAVQRCESNGTQAREAGVKGLISCWSSCASSCNSSKLLL